MAYRTQKIDQAPIVVHTHEPGPDMPAEIPAAMRNALEVIGEQPEPVYFILDLTGVRLSMDDLIKASNDATRGPGALLHHPNVIETVFVVTDEMMRLSIQGLRHEAFGSARVNTSDTIEHALDYCYQRIAEQAQG